MHKTILICLAALLLTSCSLFQSKLRDTSHYYDYFTKEKVEGRTSSQIMKDLLHKEYMAGGDYKLRIFPIVSSFVYQYTKELSSSRGLSKEQETELRQDMLNKYITGKTCIDFEIDVILREQVSNVKSWKLSLIDYKDQPFELEWREPESEPIKSYTTRGVDTLETWSHRGVACTPTEIPLERGFKVKAKAAYVRFPFDKTQQFTWLTPLKEDKKKEFGEEGYRKKEIKGYRGW